MSRSLLPWMIWAVKQIFSMTKPFFPLLHFSQAPFKLDFIYHGAPDARFRTVFHNLCTSSGISQWPLLCFQNNILKKKRSMWQPDGSAARCILFWVTCPPWKHRHPDATPTRHHWRGKNLIKAHRVKNIRYLFIYVIQMTVK